MPIDENKKAAIREQLQRIANGEKPPPIDIGSLTEIQFSDINMHRSALGLPTLESAVVVYSGRHHYSSRLKDGYNIDDMISQLESGLSAQSVVVVGKHMTALQNKTGRVDAYNITVKDQVILELTVRKPKSEAFSAIPKGDKGGPVNHQNKKPLT